MIMLPKTTVDERNKMFPARIAENKGKLLKNVRRSGKKKKIFVFSHFACKQFIVNSY